MCVCMAISIIIYVNGYKIQIFKNSYPCFSYYAISNSISTETKNNTVFLQDKVYIHVDSEISLSRIYHKEK